MSKDRRTHGRRIRANELMKRKERKANRKKAWERTINGAGPRHF